MGTPQELGHLFRLYTDRGDNQHKAVCMLLSHHLGWELRLEVNGDLQCSTVCRSQDEVLSTGEEWKAALLGKGWGG